MSIYNIFQIYILVYNAIFLDTIHYYGYQSNRAPNTSENLLEWGHTIQSSINQEESNNFFTQKRTLVIHQRVHTGKKTYPCSHCDKCLVQNKNLFKHQMIHNEEKLYLCSQCDKFFTQKQKLSED